MVFRMHATRKPNILYPESNQPYTCTLTGSTCKIVGQRIWSRVGAGKARKYEEATVAEMAASMNRTYSTVFVCVAWKTPLLSPIPVSSCVFPVLNAGSRVAGIDRGKNCATRVPS